MGVLRTSEASSSSPLVHSFTYVVENGSLVLFDDDSVAVCLAGRLWGARVSVCLSFVGGKGASLSCVGLKL